MLGGRWGKPAGQPPACRNCKGGFVENHQVVQFEHAAGGGLLHTACVRDYVLRFLGHAATRSELLAIIGGREVFARPELLEQHMTEEKR